MNLTLMGVALVLPIGLARSQPAAATPPKFEVASIKQCKGGAFPPEGRSGGGPAGNLSPGRLRLPCQDVMHFIQGAYGLFANGQLNPFSTVRISGGPAWINSDLYQLDAKADGPASRSMMNGPMLQSLLEDRLKLKIHRETREVPVYALTVAKGRPKLQPFKEGSCISEDFDNPSPPPEAAQSLPKLCGMLRGTNNGFEVPRVTMADFCKNLSGRLDRVVIDKTGIAGTFDIHLDLSLADLGYPSAVGLSESATPADIFAAVNAAVKKLGLKLKPAKGPGEFFVIDHVEKPSEN
ncbi:MAG TPA: TIGR03435 family protein [Bryobacteraceae bacterium]|nr:TIGR03435 family protein [Bryobacteraceae bacterium]